MDWNKLSEELLKRLDLVAGKMGQAGSYLWQLAVRQAYIEGVKAVLAVIFCAVLLRTAYVLIPRFYAKGVEQDWDEAMPLVGVILSCGVAFIAAIVLIVNTHIAVDALGNPQFFALRLLLEQVK